MRRINRIFRSDKKTVIVAMDHGMGLDVVPALNETGRILEQIVKGGADAVLTTFGIARKYEQILSQTGLILRLDGGTTSLTEKVDRKLLYSVEDALRLGADGVACMGFPGAENEEETLENLAKAASQCNKWNIPLMAEMLPGGFKNDIDNNVENIKFVSRLGAEMGADIIKTSFAGKGQEFKKVVKGSFSPVIVLGGSKANNLSDLFSLIDEALGAGARGVAIGRNVWKNENPQKITAALVQLIHEGKNVEQVLRQLNL